MLLLEIAPAQAFECDRITLPSSLVICSDPELQAIADERQQVYSDLWARLDPDQQKALRADQNRWVRDYATACGVSPDLTPTLPPAPSLIECFKSAGVARTAFLRRYYANIPTNPGPALASPSSNTGARDRIGPSFKCAPGQAALAQIICSDSELSQIDLLFVQSYQSLRHQLDEAGRQALRLEANDFHNSVLQECGLPRTGPVPQLDGFLDCVKPRYLKQRALWLSRLTGPAAEEANRSIKEHIAFQQKLQNLGFLPTTTEVDGVYGPATRAAISAWQVARGRDANGFLSNADAETLRRQEVASTHPTPGLTPPRERSVSAISDPMEFSYKDDKFPGMEFRLIHATGRFVEGTTERFLKFVQVNRIEAGAVVVFASSGGSVAEALSMGRMIRGMGFDTEVSTQCFSSCTIAFLGGIRRTVAREAQFGVHRLSSIASLDSKEALDMGQIAIGQIGEYAASMGVAPGFVSELTQAGSNEINLLSHDQLLSHKIVSSPFTTTWQIKARVGRFYLISETETNNGFHKMIFVCDGKGGVDIDMLYNATSEYKEYTLNATSVYQLSIDGKELPLEHSEIKEAIQPSGPQYVSVILHVSERINELLLSARVVGFMMLAPSRLTYAGWYSDFASGRDKYIEYTRTCRQ